MFDVERFYKWEEKGCVEWNKINMKIFYAKKIKQNVCIF